MNTPASVPGQPSLSGLSLGMDLHIDVLEGQFIATTPDVPGCRGIGNTADQAVGRLEQLVDTLRTVPSPFATVRKRLGER